MNMKKGFTLIEIMIVVAIIAILAAVAIPNFMTYRKTSQMNACKANMKQIVSAIEAYQVKNGAAPTALADLTLKAKGAFMKSIPACPLGGSYSTDGTDTNGNLKLKCNSTGTDSDFPHTFTF